MTSDELAGALGKRASCAVAAFTGRGPCRPLLSLFEERAREPMNENQNQKKSFDKLVNLLIEILQLVLN